ncbi:hypothetical protein PB2503_00892 [Parvularcula bermudensis HTCC2503]|uniref:DUF4870 domain-containing protein n=1 Tax=Parvularcula bermudensis (strain ATCC BAA-594 / HTCC2503 / KCTC 12087) TaxID=314260 RepID=E0TB55_PARBH|nr:hypothetical protein [Parvularcula bermudensis]ADM08259.1 hypothetical protein PB2503_00892 [Parvularcula bermudensis HTCC2503]
MTDDPIDTDGVSLTTIIYGLYLIALFTGFPFFIGVIIAYVARDGVTPAARSHYDHQVRIFWTVLITGVAIAILIATFFLAPLAWLLAAYIWVWVFIRCIRGLRGSSRGDPYEGPRGALP